MRQKILPVIALALAFFAGAFTGIFFQRHRPLPPPQFRPGEEFRDDRGYRAERDERIRASLSPEKIAELSRRLEELKPRAQVFQKKYNEIEEDFYGKLSTMLNEEQKKLLPPLEPLDWGSDLNIDRFTQPPPAPGSAPKRRSMTQFSRIIAVIIYQPSWEKMAKRLQLSEEQNKAVGVLFAERRTHFLALVDEMTPPTMQMGQIMREIGLFPPPPPDGKKDK